MRDVTFSACGTLLANTCINKTTYIRDVATGKLRFTLAGQGSAYIFQRCVFAPDSTLLAAPSDNCDICLWDMRTGQCTHKLRSHGRPVTCLTWSPHGSTLISADSAGSVKVWDVRTATATQALALHPSAVTAIAFSPAGGLLATSCTDGQIRLFDATAGGSFKLLHSFGAHAAGGNVWGLAFSPPTTNLVATTKLQLATAGGREVKLWDLTVPTAPRLLHTLTGHTDETRSLAYRSDAACLVSGSNDGTVRLWDTHTAHLQRKLTTAPAGTGVGVWGVAFHPRQTDMLAIGYENGELRLEML